MSPAPKLSPKATRLLRWLQSVAGGSLLESQVVASGLSSALNELLRAGLADMGADAQVAERGGAPAAAVLLTDKGRRAE